MATAFALPVRASAQSRGKVLAAMSSAHDLDPRDGKHYETGYYLNEEHGRQDCSADAGRQHRCDDRGAQPFHHVERRETERRQSSGHR
ncbi:hypothetical protein BCAR13_790045 [Paraburkholderia caribensis]|nr:hypothetical protein BCAR13_790045 [Paraburkholderia caribensis]